MDELNEPGVKLNEFLMKLAGKSYNKIGDFKNLPYDIFHKQLFSMFYLT